MRGAALLVSLLVTGCGLSVQPRVAVSEDDRSGRFPPSSPLPTPSVSPGPGPRAQVGATARRICRMGGIPSGWVAVSYSIGGGECPEAVDDDDLYTVAHIEPYGGLPIGATKRICADQRVPRGWIRDRGEDEMDGCPGARVAEGGPTTILIRKTSGSSF